MHWDGPILTDSGGYQIFSLASLRTHERGRGDLPVASGRLQPFPHPGDRGGPPGGHGVDIMICLDECPGYPGAGSRSGQGRGPDPEVAARSKAARTSPNAALFPVVQGGMIPALRREAAQAMADLNFDGYAIGGLSVGEPKELMLAMLEATTPELPEDKPRYLMGVGTPSDLVEAVARGWTCSTAFSHAQCPERHGLHQHRQGGDQKHGAWL